MKSFEGREAIEGVGLRLRGSVVKRIRAFKRTKDSKILGRVARSMIGKEEEEEEDGGGGGRGCSQQLETRMAIGPAQPHSDVVVRTLCL